MMRDRPDTLAQGLFIFQFLKILNSFLDRDGGIAYLAKNTRIGPQEEKILLSSAPSSHQQTHGGT